MRLFRRKNALEVHQELIAGRIAAKLLRFQRRWANWLNSKASKLGQANVLLLLMILGLGLGLWCSWLILGVLF